MAGQSLGTHTGAVTQTGFDTVLKDYYEGPVREYLNNKVTILKYTDKSSRKWPGRRVVFPLNVGRNSGVGARAESGTLPTAGKQDYVEAHIGAKFLYGRIELTGPVIAASKNNRGAFVSALKSEISGMRRDLRVDFARQTYGANIGASGVTGLVGQASGAVTIGDTATGTVALDGIGTRYIKKGMQLNFGTEGAGELGASGTSVKFLDVTSVTSATALSCTNNSGGSITVDDDDFCARGDGSDNSYGHEIAGLEFIVSANDDDFQDIDTGVNPEWKANTLDGPGGGATRPLSLELMQLAIDNTDEICGEEPNLIIAHHSARREYINLLTSDVRYSPEQLKGGFQKLTYAGGMSPMTFEFDRYAPYNKIYFLNTDYIQQYVLKDWKWADRDGSVMNRVANKDAWESFMHYYGNLGCDRRNAQTVINDVNVSNTIF